jgi:hypothetical protein
MCPISVIAKPRKRRYREGMHALVSRWRKAIDVEGDYVEK